MEKVQLHATPTDIEPVDLSEMLAPLNREDIASLREAEYPDTFVIPAFRQVQHEHTERIIEIPKKRGYGFLIADGEEFRYRGKQVVALNMLLAHEEPLALSAIANHLNSRKAYQVRALGNILQKAASPEGGAFVVAEQEGDEQIFGIDPHVAFVDHRLPKQTRAHKIRELCRKFRHSSEVSRAEAEVLSHHSADELNGSNVWFETLGATREQALLEEFSEIVDRYERNEASEHEQLQAVVAFNKLTYSFMPLAKYMVLESAGQIPFKGRRTPLSGFLRSIPEGLQGQTINDALQLASIGVIKALQTYDMAKGDLFPHVIMTINFEVREGTLAALRHMVGHTLSESREKASLYRRQIALNEEYYDLLWDTLATTGREEYEYERVLATTFAGSIVHNAMRDEQLEEVDKLILSLATGVYLSEFEGAQFVTKAGKTIIYDRNLMQNPFFRDGLKGRDIAGILDVNERTVSAVKGAALSKFADITKQHTARKYYDEKWSDDLWY